MQKKIFIIINEQHQLLPDQQHVLEKTFPQKHFEYVYYKVPATGWTKNQIVLVANELWDMKPHAFVFVSPVPLLIKLLCERYGVVFATSHGIPPQVHIFHNDKREKRELPNGKIIHSVASEGWELIH